MKIKGHQSFHIRRGWIHKGLKEINKNENLFNDKDIVLTDLYGIGSNMVTSLKYWLEALNLVERKRDGSKVKYKLTLIGKIILEKDPYLEEVQTWQLLHYNLVQNEDQATTWYWFFNEYKGSKFNRENLFNSLNSYIINKYQKEVSERSLKDDVSCLLNTYLNREIQTPEENIESPFAQLGLIEFDSKKNGEINYKKTSKKQLNELLVYYILLNIAKGKETLDLKEIIYSSNGIGNIFNLDMYQVMEKLDELQNLGYIKVIRTGGLDYISFIKKIDLIELLEKLYKH
ncbi:DUF4007 family protein [Romboutsia sedimentorum]|uniref:DUF4007 family protein n=1 Tax=Romboutsia sedimentorum TaxID=1368474 RepID=UPI0024DEE572|nr:DUF4007 family protein [Romboutsia sedimentorum]MDK2584455.1 DUF4007 family protein [Romboutsia sedimentorum]